MVRISAFLIALCMALIAASLGAVLYARFGFTGAESALAGVGALTALTVYYAVAARRNDRLETSNQLAKLARGSGDLAGQLAEFGRRLNAIEGKVDSVVDRAVTSSQPLAEEVEPILHGRTPSGHCCGRSLDQSACGSAVAVCRISWRIYGQGDADQRQDHPCRGI
jgi:hypothetical protein